MTKNNKPQMIAKLRNEQIQGYDCVYKVNDYYLLKAKWDNGSESHWTSVGSAELEHVLTLMYGADVAQSVLAK